MILCSIGNSFSDVKWALEKVRLKFYRSDILYCCNTLLIRSRLNFDKILIHELLYLTEKYTVFMLYLKFFIKCKIDLKECMGDVFQNWCLTSLQQTFGLLKIEIWWSKTISLVTFYEITFWLVQYLESFLRCKVSSKEIKSEFMQNWCLILLLLNKPGTSQNDPKLAKMNWNQPKRSKTSGSDPQKIAKWPETTKKS